MADVDMLRCGSCGAELVELTEACDGQARQIVALRDAFSELKAKRDAVVAKYEALLAASEVGEDDGAAEAGEPNAEAVAIASALRRRASEQDDTAEGRERAAELWRAAGVVEGEFHVGLIVDDEALS